MAVTGGTTNLAGGILVCVDSELFEDDQMPADNMDSLLAYWDTHMAYSGVESEELLTTLFNMFREKYEGVYDFADE
jgi:hypothetical protein